MDANSFETLNFEKREIYGKNLKVRGLVVLVKLGIKFAFIFFLFQRSKNDSQTIFVIREFSRLQIQTNRSDQKVPLLTILEWGFPSWEDGLFWKLLSTITRFGEGMAKAKRWDPLKILQYIGRKKKFIGKKVFQENFDTEYIKSGEGNLIKWDKAQNAEWAKPKTPKRTKPLQHLWAKPEPKNRWPNSETIIAWRNQTAPSPPLPKLHPPPVAIVQMYF